MLLNASLFLNAYLGAFPNSLSKSIFKLINQISLCICRLPHGNFDIAAVFRHVDVSDCGRYLIVCPQEDCRDNLVFFTDLTEATKDGEITEKLELTQLVYQFKHDYEVGNDVRIQPK